MFGEACNQRLRRKQEQFLRELLQWGTHIFSLIVTLDVPPLQHGNNPHGWLKFEP